MTSVSGVSSGKVSVLHAMPGRVRIRIDALYRCVELKAKLESSALRNDGIRSIAANVLTASVLVCYDPRENLEQALAPVLKAAGCAGAMTVAAPASRPAFTVSLGSLGKSLAGVFKGIRGWFAGSAEKPETTIEPRAMPGSLTRPWHTLEARKVAEFWETSFEKGLASAMARQRLAEYGPNTLPCYKGRSPLAMIADQFKSLPVLLLLGSAALSIFTGGIGDAVVITLVVILNASIGFATESQAERTIAALLDSAEPTAAVIRDGALTQIRGRDVVPGDLLVLVRGCQVAADARVLDADWLTVDESALTGESMPVEKSVLEIADERVPLAQRSNMVFCGTVVTGGSGLAIAAATGASTEIGGVQRLIAESQRPATPLERQLGRLSNQLVWVTGAVAGGVLAIGLLRGFSFLQMLNGAISLAVAAVPEGLPVVATTALASTVHAMLRHNVLVRRLDAIEALGAAECVCLDKTGTLTVNRMSVRWVFAGVQRYTADGTGDLTAADSELSEPGSEFRNLMEVCALCSEAEIVSQNGSSAITGSPTEVALIEMALRGGVDVSSIRQRRPLLKTEHRAEDRNYMSTWHDAGGSRGLLAVKGSPGEVLALCRHRPGSRARPQLQWRFGLGGRERDEPGRHERGRAEKRRHGSRHLLAGKSYAQATYRACAAERRRGRGDDRGRHQ